MNLTAESVWCETKRQDPLRRQMATPFISDLSLMNRVIRLETNSRTVFERTRDLFRRYPVVPHRRPEFIWRIVCEPTQTSGPPWPELSAFSDPNLRLLSFGQHCFLAIDLAVREAVGYITEGLLADETGFVSPFLNTLFTVTAGALRLTPLTGACVTIRDKGLLVMGKPNHGKTTSSYLAQRLGLDFYSDASVFLDLEDGRLRLWGDFSPAFFRTDSIAYLPDLDRVGRPYHYRDLKFLYVEEGTSISCNGHPITPVACVFLERGAPGNPRLTHLSHSDSRRRLDGSVSFCDDECFEGQHSAALSSLARVPAYHLAYGPDPGVAATFLRNILMVHSSLEVE